MKAAVIGGREGVAESFGEELKSKRDSRKSGREGGGERDVGYWRRGRDEGEEGGGWEMEE